MFPSLLLSLLLIAFCVYLAARPTETSGMATPRNSIEEGVLISFVEGPVEVKRIDGPWHRAIRGHRMESGEAIRTGPGGRAELVLPEPPVRLRLDDSSHLLLGTAGDRSPTGGRVLYGSVWAEVEPGRGGESFRLSSRGAVAEAQHAVYRLHSMVDGATQMSVYDGTASVETADGAARTVATGQALVLTADGIPYWRKIDLREGWSDGWRDAQTPVVNTAVVGSAEFVSVTRDLRSINPDVYLSVDVAMTGQETGGSGFHFDNVSVEKIRIRSKAWDRLKAAEKVELLNQTFRVLHSQYPDIRRSIVLEFDDRRPELRLRYPDSVRG